MVVVVVESKGGVKLFGVSRDVAAEKLHLLVQGGNYVYKQSRNLRGGNYTLTVLESIVCNTERNRVK